MKKLAQRVEETLANDIVYLEAKQIDPNLILVDMHNRLGSSPNVQHIHKGILSSFLKNSFDRTRPAVGICVEYKSEEGIRKLLEYNQRFTKGSRYLPPILENLGTPLYGSLACTHLNLAFRILKTGPSPQKGTCRTCWSSRTCERLLSMGTVGGSRPKLLSRSASWTSPCGATRTRTRTREPTRSRS